MLCLDAAQAETPGIVIFPVTDDGNRDGGVRVQKCPLVGLHDPLVRKDIVLLGHNSKTCCDDAVDRNSVGEGAGELDAKVDNENDTVQPDCDTTDADDLEAEYVADYESGQETDGEGEFQNHCEEVDRDLLPLWRFEESGWGVMIWPERILVAGWWG